MSDVSQVYSTSVNDQLGYSSATQKENDELGQADFLHLMTAQLQNQDPTSPLDPDQFLSQIAQFSTVQGLDTLNQGFQMLAATMLSNQALDAATLVGKEVLVPSSEINLEGEGAVRGALDLPYDASSVSIRIEDQDGQLIDTVTLGALPSGLTNFEWDGLDQDGNPFPPGKYNISATAVTASGVEAITPMVYAQVSSVDFGNFGDPMTLQLRGLGNVTFDLIRQIA